MLLLGRFRFRHAERIPPTGSFILVANHYSDFDPLVTAYALWKHGRAPHYLAKASLFRVPIVGGAKQPELMTFLNVYRKVGGAFEVQEDGIRFWHPGGALTPVQVETDVHPGFMTDWQQPLIVALTQAEGVSVVHETVYENRLGFTDALN
ncbi:MAG TPA: 1-acyl-sn-glycerol-3-phosphate acyltransferase, partial [Pseudolysinimonas sp.]|nr:1-acyl-sn-glycerol-3-phosphate acyltransferase [Pseudolysinimonas sp.]